MRRRVRGGGVVAGLLVPLAHAPPLGDRGLQRGLQRLAPRVRGFDLIFHNGTCGDVGRVGAMGLLQRSLSLLEVGDGILKPRFQLLGQRRNRFSKNL